VQRSGGRSRSPIRRPRSTTRSSPRSCGSGFCASVRRP